jgi:hypothetical protein
LIAANSCWKAEVWSQTGGFSELYARYSELGLVVNGYEDFELSLRARSHGFRLAFVAPAVVYHHHRCNLMGRVLQFYKYGIGGAFFHHINGGERIHLGRYHLDFPAKANDVMAAVLKQAVLLLASNALHLFGSSNEPMPTGFLPSLRFSAKTRLLLWFLGHVSPFVGLRANCSRVLFFSHAISGNSYFHTS